MAPKRRSHQGDMTPRTREKIGAHIRQLRVERQLSQAQVADGAFTPAFISMIESGRALPSIKSLLHIARRLRVPARATLPPDL